MLSCASFCLVHVSCTNRTQLYSAQGTCIMPVTKIARYHWSAVFSTGVIYRIHCQPCIESCMNLLQILHAKNLRKFLCLVSIVPVSDSWAERVSPSIIVIHWVPQGMSYNCWQEEKGLVTCVCDARHLFDAGDQVTFSEVKGMTQINGVTPHPVTDVHGILLALYLLSD